MWQVNKSLEATGPGRAEIPLIGGRGLRSPTDVGAGTASTSAFVTGYRIAILIFLAPQLYFILLGALDTPLAHLDIVLDLSLRKLSVLPEDDVETESEHAEPDKNQCSQQYFHLVDEA